MNYVLFQNSLVTALPLNSDKDDTDTAKHWKQYVNTVTVMFLIKCHTHYLQLPTHYSDVFDLENLEIHSAGLRSIISIKGWLGCNSLIGSGNDNINQKMTLKFKILSFYCWNNPACLVCSDESVLFLTHVEMFSSSGFSLLLQLFSFKTTYNKYIRIPVQWIRAPLTLESLYCGGKSTFPAFCIRGFEKTLVICSLIVYWYFFFLFSFYVFCMISKLNSN